MARDHAIPHSKGENGCLSEVPEGRLALPSRGGRAGSWPHRPPHPRRLGTAEHRRAGRGTQQEASPSLGRDRGRFQA